MGKYKRDRKVREMKMDIMKLMKKAKNLKKLKGSLIHKKKYLNNH